MEITTNSKSFSLGQPVITANTAHALHAADVFDALERHARGDWGEVCAADAAKNERSITNGCRLLSAYTDRNGLKFWIITEWDRSPQAHPGAVEHADQSPQAASAQRQIPQVVRAFNELSYLRL